MSELSMELRVAAAVDFSLHAHALEYSPTATKVAIAMPIFWACLKQPSAPPGNCASPAIDVAQLSKQLDANNTNPPKPYPPARSTVGWTVTNGQRLVHGAGVWLGEPKRPAM